MRLPEASRSGQGRLAGALVDCMALAMTASWAAVNVGGFRSQKYQVKKSQMMTI